MRYRVLLAHTAAEVFKHLHPEIRKQMKAGLKELADDPYAGKELHDDLSEFRSYRIKRYRIVYTIHHDSENLLKIYMIGHRKEIYDLVSGFIQSKK